MWRSKGYGSRATRASDPAYAERTMNQQQDPKPEDEATKEQGQADDRRRKDQSEKIERDRADEAGRRSREGT